MKDVEDAKEREAVQMGRKQVLGGVLVVGVEYGGAQNQTPGFLIILPNQSFSSLPAVRVLV